LVASWSAATSVDLGPAPRRTCPEHLRHRPLAPRNAERLRDTSWCRRAVCRAQHFRHVEVRAVTRRSTTAGSLRR